MTTGAYRHGWTGVHWRVVIGVLSVLAVTLAVPGAARAAGPTCTTTPFGTYSVKVCLTVGSGTTVSGDISVSSTVTITGASPGIRKLEYALDGSYLITDFENPYGFTLPTADHVDGQHTVTVDVLLRDGQVATSLPVTVTFSNGTTSPPPQPTGFQATSGTPAAPGQPFVVAATGDGAGGRTAADNVVNLVESWNPNMFLYLGDVYEKGTSTEFYNWYGKEGQRFGKFKSITNPIIGNHEYENGVAPGYFGYWATPPDYYSYDAGGWHFIALNSNSQFNQYAPGTPQYDWLAADLAAHPDGCALAYFHHPVVSVGPQGPTPSMNQIWQLMVDNGVDIVLTGHDHQYQRWQPLDRDLKVAPDGVTEFVAGGGGHGIQSTVTTDNRVAAIADTTSDGFGALRLELSGGSALYQYVNPGGAVRDSGSIQCSGLEPDTTPPSVPQNVTATAPDSPDVTVSWDASSDDHGVASYEIRRDSQTVATVEATQTSWIDTTTAPNTTYSYTVRAIDLSGNASGWSQAATVTTPDAQTVFTWQTSEDAYVDATKPTTNLGSRPDLRIDGSPVQRSYLRFQVSGIGSKVPNPLTLRVHAGSNLSAGFEVRAVSGAWSESAVTYDNAPATGALLATSGPVAGGTWVEIPLTGLVSGDGTYDIALNPLSNTALKLDARESGSAAELVGDVSGGGTNATPVAGDVELTTDEDSTGTWTPEVFDADGDPLTCAIDTPPASGQATVATNCSSGSYVPAADANGSDSFTYRVTDSHAASSTGTVSVTVNPVNDAPVAGTVSGSTWSNTSTDLTLSAEDVDGDCPLAFEIVAPPAHGSLSAIGAPQCGGGSADATVTYTANANWTGSDTFTYLARDPGALESTALATVVVTAPPAQFTVVTSADAFVDADRPTTNFGSRVDLRLDQTPEQQVHMRFDVTGLGSQPATGATLRVHAVSSLSAGFEVHRTGAAWSESTITYATRPQDVGPLLATSGPVTGGTWVDISLPGVITGDGTYDFVLVPLSTTALRLDSRETSMKPELVVVR